MDFKHLFPHVPPTTFSRCNGWSVLWISLIFTLATVLLSHRKTVHPLAWHDNIATVEFQIRKAKPEKLCHSEWQNNRIVRQWSAYLLLGHSHILHNEWLGKWGLAQAQCLVYTTNRTQEGISRFFGKKLVWIQQHGINSVLTGLMIGLVGSNLALLAAGFSLESCFLLLQTQRNRLTTKTKVYLSQVAFAQIINAFANKFASRHSLTDAFPHGKWLQKSGWLSKWTLFRKNKHGKWKQFVISFTLRKPWGYMVATNYKK